MCTVTLCSMVYR